MDAKKCDRCKKYYEKYIGINERNKEENVYKRYEIPYNQLIVCNSKYSKTVPDKFFDLCPDCMVEFDKWING